MSGYAKLFSSIITSTIWETDSDTTKVFCTMLAMADANGIVEGSIPGLATMARVPLEKAEAALRLLMSPDPYSRSKECEGRRIDEIDGGWRFINYEKYRNKRDSEEKRAQDRDRQKRHRMSRVTSVTSVTERDERDSHAKSQKVAQAEAEAEAIRREEDARDPSATYQDEVRQLERNRQHHHPPPQRHNDGHENVVQCPECGHPMRLIRGKLGPFYCHPRGVGLGCEAKFNAEDHRLAADAAAERKRAADASAPTPDRPWRAIRPSPPECPKCGGPIVDGRCYGPCGEARGKA
jgi:hypothetical protein